jgi:flavin-dependent dehydrogenase
MNYKRYGLAVIGAGSGGIGAALAAGRMGLKTVLIEEQELIGGTAVNSGVNVWEPGIGGTGIPFDIYRRLTRIPSAATSRGYSVRVPAELRVSAKFIAGTGGGIIIFAAVLFQTSPVIPV